MEYLTSVLATTTALFVAAQLLFQAIIVSMIILRGRTSHSVRVAWILVVIALPLFGGLLYLRFGRVLERASTQKHRRIRYEVQHLAEAATREPGDVVDIQHKELRKGAHLIEELGGMPPCGGNRLRLFGDSSPDDSIVDAFQVMIQDIDRASRSCHLLFYIYLADETGQAVGEALIRAAERGVECRLLVDALGSRQFFGSPLAKRMKQSGVRVASSLSVNPIEALISRFDHRNHRKIAVIDGQIGWTGSQNLAHTSFAVKAKFAPWIDILVRVEGPVVHDLQQIFVEDWLLDHGGAVEEILTPRPDPLEGGIAVQILPSGPSANTEAMKEVSLLGFLETDEELILTTPYFVPDDAITAAIHAIARAGVRTVLVVPKRNDSRIVGAASRSYYDELLRAGVEIYEFPDGLLHAKTFTFDGIVSVVATANLDRRSYELNYEVSMVVADQGFTAELRAVQMAYIERSERVDPYEWRERPVWRRALENTAGLLAPLL